MAPSSDGRTKVPAWRERVVFAYLEEPPFCFRAAGGGASGCDVQLAQAVLRDLGVAACDFVEAEFADLIPGLIDGRWTMTTGLFVTAERRKRIAFSRPIWALHDGLLVRAGNPRSIAGYRSIAADANATLATVKDQRQRDSAIELGVLAARIVEFHTQKEAADAVANGTVDAYASVAMAHRGYLASHPNGSLAVVDVSASEQAPAFGAFGLAQSNAGMADEIDRALGRVPRVEGSQAADVGLRLCSGRGRPGCRTGRHLALDYKPARGILRGNKAVSDSLGLTPWRHLACVSGAQTMSGTTVSEGQTPNWGKCHAATGRQPATPRHGNGLRGAGARRRAAAAGQGHRQPRHRPARLQDARSTSSRRPSRRCATAITATRRRRASCRCARPWRRI